MSAIRIEELSASESNLQERVLVYLKKHGPSKWVRVYLHFDHGATGEIGPALNALAILEQIEVEDLGYIQITRAGLDRIANRK